MKRKLLLGERIIYANGTLPFNGAFAVKIKGSFTPERLRHALRRVQAKHPLLTAHVEHDDQGIPWFVTNEQSAPEVPVRIVERLTENDWQHESKIEWTTCFDTAKGPLIRVVWLRSDEVSDLVLVGHHCLCDGASFLTILRELLTVLDQPDADIGESPAFSSLADLIPQHIRNSKFRIFKTKLTAIAIRAVMSLMVAGRKTQAAKGEGYLIHWKLDKEASAAVFRRCKAAGVTVHTALCAAFLGAFRQVKGDKALNKMMCPVDIRKYVPEIRKDAIFAFDLSVELSVSKRKTPDFWAEAAKLQEMLSKKTAKLNGYEFLMISEHMQRYIRLIQRMLDFGPVTNDLLFSNMGRLDIPQQFQSFEVSTIYSPTAMGPFAPSNGLVTTTFRDQLDLVFISSDAFLPREEAEAIREYAMALLLQGSSIPEGAPALIS